MEFYYLALQTLQSFKWVAVMYTVATPTSTYTSFSTVGIEPRTEFTKLKSKSPQRPQLIPPTRMRRYDTTCNAFK